MTTMLTTMWSSSHRDPRDEPSAVTERYNCVLRNRGRALSLAAVLAVYAVLAFGVLSTDVVSSGDIGVKFVQAHALLDSGFRSLAMPNRGSVIDPHDQFSPFRAPFVFRAADGKQAIFPPAAAIVQAPFVGLAGVAGMRLLAIIAAGIVLWCASGLVDRGSRYVPIILGAATPLWFYGVTESEHAIGVAFSTAAFVAAASGTSVAGAIAGLLLAAGASIRDECVLLLPAVAVAIWWTSKSWKPVALTIGFCAAGLLLAGAVEVWWFGRPLAAHLQHAVHLARSALHLTSTPNPELPRLTPMTLQERYDTMVEYWLLGLGTTISMLLVIAATILSIVVAVWRHDRRPLLVMLAFLTILAAIDAASLIRAPKFVAGLYRLSPFLIFALLPRADDDRGPVWFGRVVQVAFASYIGLAFLGMDTSGGKSLGPRLLLPLVPLMGASAIVVILGYLQSPKLMNRLVGACGAALIAASMAIHVGSTLPAWIERTRQDADRLNAIADADQHVLVADDMFTAQQLLPLYYRRIILLADDGQEGAALGAALEREKIPSVLLVSRNLNPETALPPLQPVWTSARFRFLIQVWRR